MYILLQGTWEPLIDTGYMGAACKAQDVKTTMSAIRGHCKYRDYNTGNIGTISLIKQYYINRENYTTVRE